MKLKSNIENVLERIKRACDRSYRSPEEITLVAVSKKFSVEKIEEAFECGIRNFGENYGQEFRDKYCRLKSEYNNLIDWHFIGNLQRNKVKYVVGKASLVHTIDGLSLAIEIDKKAKSLGIKIDSLIEVNIASEKSKSGVKIEEVGTLMEKVRDLDGVKVKGFMVMTPYFDDVEKVRPYFSKMRKLRDNTQSRNPQITELSMGMSGDFEIAIEEGATIVRVGSAIFGSRV